jgi:uncharacterized membrane protein
MVVSAISTTKELGLAEKPESAARRLIRFMVLGVPTVSRILAVALIVAAIGIAFFDLGDYGNAGDRAGVALLLSVFALLSLALGFIVPAIVRRAMPKR